MEIIVNKKTKEMPIREVGRGGVFRFDIGSQYWMATDDYYDSKLRHCVAIDTGVLEALHCDNEVIVVEAKLEVSE